VSLVADAESFRAPNGVSPNGERPAYGFRVSGDLQDGGASAQAFDVVSARAPARKDALDVTAVLVFCLVALGLFIVPLGATLMQNEAVAAVVSSIE
jgi:hypothetical protein